MASSSQYPGWAYLLAGVAIGLFVSFLLYLQNLPSVDNSVAQRPKNANPPPTFEFYDILPDFEVVVPELSVKTNKKPQATNVQPPKPSSELSSGEAFVLQVAAFRELKQADKLKAKLALMGLEPFLQKVTIDDKTFHRVRIGPFTSKQALTTARQRLKENNIDAKAIKVSS